MEEKFEKTHQQGSEDEVAEECEEEMSDGNKSIENGEEIESKIQEDDQKNNTTACMEMKLRQKKALLEFRCMVENAILGNSLVEKPQKNISKREAKELGEQGRDISLWGVPLLPTKGHESTDNLLLKFLKAKDFKAQESFDMLEKTLKWRKEYKVDEILEENVDLGVDIDKFLNIYNQDKEGHHLYYTNYGAFKDKVLYKKLLGTEADREKFLRWRIQFMEKCVRKLSFKSGEADSLLQIIDFKNTGLDMKELRDVTKKYFLLLQENYPEVINKIILINVPFWSRLFSFMKRGKCIIVRQSKVAQTLLKYITPENLPVEYGGLQRENDGEFSPEDNASELVVRANSAGCIKIPVSEAGVTMVWDFTVVGWEVTCKEEFIPENEASYRILLRKYKERKIGESVRNSFYISEPGKIVITIENTTLKKRRIYYRSKSKPYLPNYMIVKK